jgi:DNA invertase Pin-like site-specific DNA recombinase
VSTAEQSDSGLGLAAQRAAIERECGHRGWRLIGVHEDAGVSGKSMRHRDGLSAALSALDSGAAGTLMVAKLDRLSRSLLDFAALMADAQNREWNLVAMDLGIDLSTPAGEFMASVMASAAQWERRIIGQRTKDALAVRRSQGIKLGRPRLVGDDVIQRIVQERVDGDGWTTIAERLNTDRVSTVQGGKRWYPTTVRNIYLAAGSSSR